MKLLSRGAGRGGTTLGARRRAATARWPRPLATTAGALAACLTMMPAAVAGSDGDADWAVIQQGMNDATRYARRYHWLGATVADFVSEPHAAVVAERREERVLNLVAGEGDAHRAAIRRLAEYDEQRSTFLLRTLEEFLRRHGNISATSEALFVHQNTLRQRLRRIQELSGIDLRRDDWLMLEIALKLVRLEGAAGHTPRPS